MGTPDFAVPSLSKIVESKHRVLAIVTAPDKERGRGQKVTFTPVKEYAISNNIPLLQPLKLKDPQFIENLKAFNADLFVVVAFRILPKEIFTLPSKGSFNLHGSLLPKYRGAAPIQWAIINGETETGVTTFSLEEKVDTGNIYLQKKMDITDDDDFGSVHDRLSILGAEAVVETIDLIVSNIFNAAKQIDEKATPAPKITKETGLIDWHKDAKDIHNLIRGLSPYPGAYFFFNNKMLKVFKSEVINDVVLKPGEMKPVKDGLFVGCGKNALRIYEIQQEGRKKMQISEFLRGFSFNL